MSVVYISGCMTGQPDHGVAQFAMARTGLRQEGRTVLCPSELSQPNRGQPRSFHMRKDIHIVLDVADEVCLLPGWEKSLGAKVEALCALEVGKPVWLYESRRPVTIDMIEINVKELATNA